MHSTEPHTEAARSRVTHVDFVTASEKRRLRELGRIRRAEVDPQQRRANDLARMRHLLAEVPRDAVIATYLSIREEPATLELVAVLWRRGHRILAPRLTTADCRRLGPEPAWGWYRGPSQLRPGFLDIPEPVGERLPAAALGQADVVIVSGVAGGRDGSRIGSGAGWFDRALADARGDAQVWLLLNDDELFDSLPQEGHDRLVDAVISESGVTLVGAGQAHTASRPAG